MTFPLSILVFHRVHARPDPLFPDALDAAGFEWQLRLLRRYCKVLPLGEALQRLREGRLPWRAVALSFDDGYADNAEVALPILLRLGMPASFFIASGYLGAGQMWNDRVIECVRAAPGAQLRLGRAGLGVHAIATLAEKRRTIEHLLAELKYLPQEERQARVDALPYGRAAPMMGQQQVLALHRAGMELGAHTVSHPILSCLSPADAYSEIGRSRGELEQIIQARVPMFAYPNGKPGTDFGPEHMDMVQRLGFDCALSTQWGAARRTSNRFALPRFTPWDRSTGRYLLRLGSNLLRRVA